MTKEGYVGVAVGVIAIIVILAVTKPSIREEVVNENTSNGGSSLTQEETVEGASADGIFASFNADADIEAADANSEAEDETYVNSQVDTFSSFNQTQYENDI